MKCPVLQVTGYPQRTAKSPLAVLKAYLVPRHCQIDTGKPSKETAEILRELLALHYIDGGVPAPIVSLVETCLKGLNLWFPDPQYPYLEGEGYL